MQCAQYPDTNVALTRGQAGLSLHKYSVAEVLLLLSAEPNQDYEVVGQFSDIKNDLAGADSYFRESHNATGKRFQNYR